MSYVITEPQLMASVAAEINGIGAKLSAANAAAAGPTSTRDRLPDCGGRGFGNGDGRA
ncbi:PE domain-containing protein [Mycobacterium sp.]|uniref:PE domain-containing protein n=1 Tax=Mycobacterium sp. TaxID=1785 RepID=UPI003C786D43